MAARVVVEPTGEPVPLSSWRSACPVAEWTADRRVDPYWQGLWPVGGSQASWLSAEVAWRREEAGLGRVRRADRRLTAERARADLLRGCGRWGNGGRRGGVTRAGQRGAPASHRHEGRLASLAAVGMWRTLSAQQVVAMTGFGLGPALTESMSALWAAGLVERGELVSGMVGSKLPALFRACDSTAVDAFLADLPYREWVAVTGGQPWTLGPRHDRHNMLTTELGLRIAEYCEVSAVLGESMAGFHLLDPSGATPTSTTTAADAVVIRPDGLRVCLETTANAGSSFERKVDRWVEFLMSTDHDDLGAVVCFVESARPDDRNANDLFRTVRRTVERAVGARSGAVRRRLAQRMFVARWRWWFPAPSSATAGFRTLVAVCPDGSGRDNRWREAHMLDLTDVTFDPSPALERLEVDFNTLLGTPFWLRQGEPVDLGPVIVSQAGLTELPVPAARNRER